MGWMRRPRVQEDPMVTSLTVMLYELPNVTHIQNWIWRDLFKITYQYYGTPIRHFSRLRSSSPRYQATWTRRKVVVSIPGRGGSVGRGNSPWPGLRLRCYLHWQCCPGTSLEQSQNRGHRGARAPSVFVNENSQPRGVIDRRMGQGTDQQREDEGNEQQESTGNAVGASHYCWLLSTLRGSGVNDVGRRCDGGGKESGQDALRMGYEAVWSSKPRVV
jgi:hypothetical protein